MPAGAGAYPRQPKSGRQERPSGSPAAAASGLLESLPPTARQSELASLFNVQPRVIRDLAERGIVERIGRGRYETLGSIRAYLDHLRRMAAGRTSEGLSLADERALTEKVKRVEAELRVRKLKGEMLPVEEVRAGWTRFATIVRTAFLSLPSKIRAAVPHLTAHDAVTIGGLVRERLEDAAAELADGGMPGAGAPDELSHE